MLSRCAQHTISQTVQDRRASVFTILDKPSAFTTMIFQIKPYLIPFLLFGWLNATAQKPKTYNGIYSGVPRFDDKGDVVSAHGACIIKDGGRHYLFGEKHSDTSNAFVGFNCYSSADLYNWRFENIAFPLQTSGKLGPNRVGARVKVMKCPKSGEYVMYSH